VCRIVRTAVSTQALYLLQLRFVVSQRQTSFWYAWIKVPVVSQLHENFVYTRHRFTQQQQINIKTWRNMTSCKLSTVIGSNRTSPRQVVRWTPPIRFVVDLLWTCWRLSICCTCLHLVVQQILNKSNKWSLSFKLRSIYKCRCR